MPASKFCREGCTFRQMRQRVDQKIGQRFVVRRSDVMPVHIFKLGEIEPRRRAADMAEIESRDHLLGRKNSWSPWLQPSRTR